MIDRKQAIEAAWFAVGEMETRWLEAAARGNGAAGKRVAREIVDAVLALDKPTDVWVVTSLNHGECGGVHGVFVTREAAVAFAKRMDVKQKDGSRHFVEQWGGSDGRV